MDATITAIQNTPLPKILILSGLFFLLLGVVNKIGGIIEVSPETKRWTFPIGLVVFVIGMVLNFSSATAPSSTPIVQIPPGKTPSTAPEEPKKVVYTGPPPGRVQLMNVNSRLCLTPVSAGKERNDEVLQDTCNTDATHTWTFTEIVGDTAKVRNENSQLCLTVAGGNTFNNTVSVQYLCDSDASRRWRYVPVEESRFRLVNTNSGLCLTVAGGSPGKDVRAVQYPCDGDPARDWIFRRVD